MYHFSITKRNDINTYYTHFIFKSTIGFLGLTNSIVDFKLDCMEICKRCVGNVCVSFLNYKEKWYKYISNAYEVGRPLKDKLIIKTMRALVVHFVFCNVAHHVYWFVVVCVVCSCIVTYLELTLVNDETDITDYFLFSLLKYSSECLL